MYWQKYENNRQTNNKNLLGRPESCKRFGYLCARQWKGGDKLGEPVSFHGRFGDEKVCSNIHNSGTDGSAKRAISENMLCF